jgi:transcription elongation factor Elf1
MIKKRCPKCGRNETKKYGKQNGKQQYFCKICEKKFQLKEWAKPKLQQRIIAEYSEGKQTQKQIGEKIGKTREWVNQYLKSSDFSMGNYNRTLVPQSIILLVDTTYFEQFGLMVFRSANLKKNLLWYIVEHETNGKYKEGIEFLQKKGWKIEILIADGKPGLGKLFPEIPFQLCQFHLFQTVTRYISKKPKLLAGKELRDILFRLKDTDQESFFLD